MSEVKTIRCFPHFVGSSEKALYKFSEFQGDISLHLNFEEVSGIGICKTAFYTPCQEGELVVAVNTEEIIGVNLEEGELIMVFSEEYDFEVDSNGCLLMKKIHGGSHEVFGGSDGTFYDVNGDRFLGLKQ